MLRPITIVFISLAIAAVVGVWGVFAWNAGFEELDVIVGRYPSTRIPGLDHFHVLDRGLLSMAAFNLPVVGREPVFSAGRLFMAQFLANVFAIPIILLTENFRAVPGSWTRQWVFLICCFSPAWHDMRSHQSFGRIRANASLAQPCGGYFPSSQPRPSCLRSMGFVWPENPILRQKRLTLITLHGL